MGFVLKGLLPPTVPTNHMLTTLPATRFPAKPPCSKLRTALRGVTDLRISFMSTNKLIRTYTPRSTRDRSTTRSLQRRVSTTSSILQLRCIYSISLYRNPCSKGQESSEVLMSSKLRATCRDLGLKLASYEPAWSRRSRPARPCRSRLFAGKYPPPENNKSKVDSKRFQLGRSNTPYASKVDRKRFELWRSNTLCASKVDSKRFQQGRSSTLVGEHIRGSKHLQISRKYRKNSILLVSAWKRQHLIHIKGG